MTFPQRLATLLCCASVVSCSPRLATPSGNTARVLVYNIHAGKDAAGVDNLERVAEVVRRTGADIVLLQEVDKATRRSAGVDQPAVLARLTGLYAAFGSTLDYQGGGYGIAILSRWPIVSDTLVSLPVSPPQERSGGSYEPRGALRVEIATPMGRIIAINTHLDASGEDRWRRQEVRTVLAIADDARGQTAHVLVGGDFNAIPESAVHDTIRAGSLRDVWQTCGRGDGFTYPARSGIKRIDYLFIGGRTRCTSAEVVDTEASDHRPLLVTIRLRT